MHFLLKETIEFFELKLQWTTSWLIVLLLVVMQVIGFAQIQTGTAYEAKLDSLNHLEDDQEKALYHYQLAQSFGYDQILKLLYHSIEAERLIDKKNPIAIDIITHLGATYDELQVFEKTLEQGLKAMKIAKENKRLTSEVKAIYNIISAAIPLEAYDLTKQYCLRAIEINPQIDNVFDLTYIYQLLGLANLKTAEYEKAIEYYQLGLDFAIASDYEVPASHCQEGLAITYAKIGDRESALYYAQKAKQRPDFICEKCLELAEMYTSYKDYKSANECLKEIERIRTHNETTYNNYNIASTLLADNFEKQKTALEQTFQAEQIQHEFELRNRNLLLLILLGATLLGLIIAYNQYKANKIKKDLLEKISKKNTAISQANKAILKTQNQLVIQEKMASLGQLTSGIAHELKNPLNFVINFSEGSREMLLELKEYLAKQQALIPDVDYTNIVELVEELAQNSIDINENGNRAVRIIQSMMNHARGTQKQKEVIDFNKLVGDNISLLRHSIRTNNRGINIKITHQFDQQIDLVKLYPQEFSRVLINLLNNAVYAVSEKITSSDTDYQPTILIETLQKEQTIALRIRDNGMGIPNDIRTQIFDPFFTTKPTGAGNTGLGLSISYDIIVKRHAGKLEIKSEERQFTEFIITLPNE